MTVLAINGVGAKCGGAATVLAEVVEAALAASEVSRVLVFASPAPMRRFTFPNSNRLEVVDCGWWVESAAGRLGWLAGDFERTARRSKAEALLTLAGGGLASGAWGERRTAFVQQALPFWPLKRKYLDLRTRVRMLAVERFTRDSCERARSVAVQSDWMKEALCGAFSVDPGKVVVLPPSVPSCPGRSRNGRGRHGPLKIGDALRMLYVGSAEKYKNLGVAASAASTLRNAGLRIELVATIDHRDQLCRAGLATGLGYLDRERLEAEYERADLVIMPSLIETAGLPMLEAMAFGVPVVAADLPYAHELCGEAAAYFDPLRVEALVAVVTKIAGDEALWRRMSCAGRHRADELRNGRPYSRLIELAIAK